MNPPSAWGSRRPTARYPLPDHALRDRRWRFYAVWGVPNYPGLSGIHVAVGTRAHSGLLALVGGQFDLLLWRRVQNYEEGVQLILERTLGRVPSRTLFIW